MAPVSYLTLELQNGRVSAHCQTCLLFAIPYKTQHVSHVSEIATRIEFGELVENMETRNRDLERQYRSEDEGFMIIKGDTENLEVPLSRVDLEQTRREIEEFMAQSSISTYRKFCVANWKFSILAGVPLCLLTAIYLIGIGSSLVTLPFRLARRIVDRTSTAST